MIIKGTVKILEKGISNKDDNDWSMNFVRFFSEIENKDKFVLMNNDNFRKVNVDDFIYIEYFTDSNLIKILEFNNRKLNSVHNQIYDSVNP